MDTYDSRDIQSTLHDMIHDPSRVMDYTLELMEEALEDQNGKIMDPSQPLPFLVENDVLLANAAVQSFEAVLMKQYPIMAQTDEDLFIHMSDIDLEGMYATPGEAYFTILLSRSEVVSQAVQIDDSRSYKITIPKHTSILVNDIAFTMQYPINIVVRPHGGIDINYDVSDVSPLQTIVGNKVEWEEFDNLSNQIGGSFNQYLKIDIPVKQMKLSSYSSATSSTAIFKETYPFEDQFVKVRAYRKRPDGTFEEIRTTHSEHTYDPTVLTLQVNVIGQTVKVELPYVYQSTGLGPSSLRIDIYTTKGERYLDMSSLPSGQFAVKFADLDNTDNNRYSSALGKIDSFAMVSQGALDGGKNAPTFEQRRARVLRNTTGTINTPISHNQLEDTLTGLGFDVVLNTDDVIGRTYQVSRMMGENRYGLTTSPIDSAVMTARSTIEDLVLLDTVVDNISQVTITPDTLYKDVAGSLIIVPDEERIELGNLKGDVLANALTTNNYLYTPLHYVVDIQEERVDVRPYFLSRPRLGVSSFYAINETMDLQVASSNSFFVEYTPTGYRVVCKTKSNDPYKELDNEDLNVQLAFKPDVENELVYVNGTLLSIDSENERTFEFRIDTDWILRDNHQLTTKNFTLRVDETQFHDTPLKGEFFLIWSVNDYYVDNLSPSEVDEMLGRHLLDPSAVGIYAEKFEIDIGAELTGLWRRSRPIAGTMSFKTYTYDLQMTYPSNIYEYDAEGKIVIITNDEGKRELKMLHKKGDPVFNEQGEPEYVFRKGEVMMDEFNMPIPDNPREVTYWWDMILFDAKYRYATRPLDMEYERTYAQDLVKWVNVDLKQIEEVALERTEFNFHPRNSLKYIQVLADDGEVTNIYSAQRLVVDVYMDSAAFRDAELREVMTNSISRAIKENLNKTVFSNKQTMDDIGKLLGESAVTVSLSGIGGANFKVVTLLDKTTRLCMAKVLSVESDGSLSIKDDLQVNFKRHAMH